MAAPEIEDLIKLLSKLPGLGPRSARRAALYMIKRRAQLMEPLANSLSRAAGAMRSCEMCGNIDTQDPCALCSDVERDDSVICVVEDVADLWAMERVPSYRGRYHVLGGTLSPLDSIGPDELNIPSLIRRAEVDEVAEVILATNATVAGQTTAHYIAERLSSCGVTITQLAHGVPVGGELDYLDDGTLAAALRARHSV